LQAQPDAKGDLVLCSHVLYYIPHSEWRPTVARMASWLTPVGALTIVLQNHETDCMRMLEVFHGRRFNLAVLGDEFTSEHGQDYCVERHVVPANVTTPDFNSAYVIAGFMINLLPIRNLPPRQALEEYISKHFAQPGGGYRFTCDQDFLVIRPRPHA